MAGRCLIALMSPLECVWVCLCPLACVATFRLVTTHEEYRRTLDNIIHSHTGLHARARVSTKQKGKYIDGENTNSQPFIAPGERVGLRCILRAPQTYPFNPSLAGESRRRKPKSPNGCSPVFYSPATYAQ